MIRSDVAIASTTLIADRRGGEGGDDLGAKDCTEPVVIVDVIVIEVGAGVIPGYPRVIVVVLLGEPLVSVKVIHLRVSPVPIQT